MFFDFFAEIGEKRCKRSDENYERKDDGGKVKMNYLIKPAADVKDDLMGYTIVSASLGASGEICILGVNEVPEMIDGMFPPVQTETTFNYKAVIEGKGYRQEVELKNQSGTIIIFN